MRVCKVHKIFKVNQARTNNFFKANNFLVRDYNFCAFEVNYLPKATHNIYNFDSKFKPVIIRGGILGFEINRYCINVY